MTVAARTRALDKRYYGVVVALVEKVEGDPEKEGRIKIKFPWFDEGTITEWVRVRHLYGGDGYGTFFIPEEKTEVLVAFIHGDMRAPIILGSLYNGKDKPPSERTATRDEKLIRTKGGHEVLLDDSKGKLKVRIKSNGKHLVELDDQNQKLTISTANGHSAVFDDAGQKVTVKTAGGDSATFDGAQKKITLQSTSVEINASSVKLGSGASHPVILGDLFLAFFNAHVHGTAVGPTTPPQPTAIPQAVTSFVTKTS
jgi:uncharacterized protein involved in type VI secretion and phage assembly